MSNNEIVSVGPTSKEPEEDLSLLYIEDEYKRILSSLNYEPHYVNRDGDLFTIICPHCGSRNIDRVGTFFICARRHIFSLYLEDGLRKESEMSEGEKKRILGDDLDMKTLMDSHGHEKYVLFNKDDNIPMYFSLSLWGLSDEESTLNNAKLYRDIFKDHIKGFKNKFKRMNIDLYHFYTDFDEALRGKVSYRIKSDIYPFWMQKAIVISEELEKINFNNEEIYVNLFFV